MRTNNAPLSHHRLFRDYVEAFDLYLYIARSKGSKRISILREITPKGAPPTWLAKMKDRSSLLCLDCGVDTIAIDEYYMVTHELWANSDGMLCIGCLEKRLGRELTPDDFSSCWDDRVHPKSERLLKRLGDSRKREAKLKEFEEASKRFTETMRRKLDAWEPLLAVADLAGGTWPDLARKAAVALLAAAVSDTPQSLNIRLLSDLRTVFAAKDAAVQATTPKGLPTKVVLEELHALEDAPWSHLKEPLNGHSASWPEPMQGLSPCRF